MVVIGGTQEENKNDLKNDDAECQRIIERCGKLIPSIKSAKIISKSAGLRPCRKGNVRLEMEKIANTKIVHNYVIKIFVIRFKPKFVI